MKNRNLLRNWIGLTVIVFIFFWGVKSYWQFLKSPLGNQDGRAFVVLPGEGTSSIAKRLEKEGIIRSSNAFKLELLLRGMRGEIESGDFKLSKAMSTDEIIENLSKGSIDKWATLIEGLRVEEMAEVLNEKLQINSEQFIKVAKEGYMFPDTYLFNPESSALDIAKKMEENFKSKITDDLSAKFKKQGLSLDQAVILASIVEREARSDKVRTEVASILLKRLKIGMGLNVDATLQYALGYQEQEKSWWKRHLTAEDKQIQSFFNTYKYKGLPPKPICNPSLSSLFAVANADSSTPYFYYYHDSKGNSYYAVSLEEHNTNVANNP